MKRIIIILLSIIIASIRLSAQHTEASGTINEHPYIDLGLSVKWATMNIGAEYETDYGNSYAWGEVKPKGFFAWKTYFDSKDQQGKSFKIYRVGGKMKISSNSDHDAARANWGGTWRLPTIEEMTELIEKCVWTWKSSPVGSGYIVTGPNGNSIFLPASGSNEGYYKKKENNGGYYMTNSISSKSPDCPMILGFYVDDDFSSGPKVYSFSNRSYGISVRAVSQ